MNLISRLTAAALGVTVLAAACGGGPASASGSSNQSVYRQYHAYSLCMRTHGAPFWPEPTAVSHGTFDSPYAYVITKRVLAQEHGAGWRAALRHCGTALCWRSRGRRSPQRR